jgi:hypothetical protein
MDNGLIFPYPRGTGQADPPDAERPALPSSSGRGGGGRGPRGQ